MSKLIWRFDFLIHEIGVGISPWDCWRLKIECVRESLLTLDNVVVLLSGKKEETREEGWGDDQWIEAD